VLYCSILFAVALALSGCSSLSLPSAPSPSVPASSIPIPSPQASKKDTPVYYTENNGIVTLDLVKLFSKDSDIVLNLYDNRRAARKTQYTLEQAMPLLELFHKTPMRKHPLPLPTVAPGSLWGLNSMTKNGEILTRISFKDISNISISYGTAEDFFVLDPEEGKKLDEAIVAFARKE
jgi:hypothetical protein